MNCEQLISAVYMQKKWSEISKEIDYAETI